MGKSQASTARSSQPIRKQPDRGSKQRVAKDQLAHAMKRAAPAAAQRRAPWEADIGPRRGSAAAAPEPGSDLGPNLPAVATALEHMYATMNGTLAPGQEPAKYSSLYQYLPKHLRIEEGTVIPQRPPLTSFGGDTINCLYSEEVANELCILECGSVERGRELVKETLQTADYIGGQPDPEDPTIDRIDLPNLPFHIRLWLGHQKTFVSFDFCDNQTRRPVLKHRNLTIFMQSPGSLNALQLQPLEKCFRYDQSVGYNSFVVPESAVLEIRWMGKNIRTVQMPARAKPAQPARAARGVHEVAKSPIQFLAEVTGNPHIAAMIKG